MKSDKTAETRLDIFVRVIGLVFVVIGGAIAFATATTPLAPQLGPFFYLVATLFVLSGLAAVIAELR